jgi:hypothetical protein
MTFVSFWYKDISILHNFGMDYSPQILVLLLYNLPLEIVNAVCRINLVCGLKTWLYVSVSIFTGAASQGSCSHACAGIDGSKPN